MEFLPRALHQPMQLLLAEWMYLPWQEANRAAAAARGATQGGSQAVLDTRQAEQIQVGPGACRVDEKCAYGLMAGRMTAIVAVRHDPASVLRSLMMQEIGHVCCCIRCAEKPSPCPLLLH